MGKPIIEVQNLGKQYRLGILGARTLREDAGRLVRGLLHPGDRAHGERKGFSWALRHITFDIQPGEVVGFIGGNGAGKSTLLKLLARITEPSEGHARIRGRVAALLEVGSGFHNELTGRENIFLNAAILGMSRADTRKRLDEIIDFSGVEKYIDTPVKRYSSGMRVRLAFAVAAFLEPDILIADEVLAVGDATFQKKSLGKMNDVAKQGRTVLFVSHDLAAVQNLCKRVIVLKKGRFLAEGPPGEAIRHYLAGIESGTELSALEASAPKSGPALTGFSISQGHQTADNLLTSGKPAVFAFDVRNADPRMICGLEIYSDSGILVSRTKTERVPFENLEGDVRLVCAMDELLLTPGRYRVAFLILMGSTVQQFIEHLTIVEVKQGDIGYHRLWSQQGCGFVHLPQTWSCEPVEGASPSLVGDVVAEVP